MRARCPKCHADWNNTEWSAEVTAVFRSDQSGLDLCVACLECHSYFECTLDVHAQKFRDVTAEVNAIDERRLAEVTA